MEFRGDPPIWLHALSEKELRLRYGAQTIARGVRYAQEGAVFSLQSDFPRRSLRAKVNGSHGELYLTEISAPLHRSSVFPVSSCSCPVQSDCKHVIAVLLVAQRWLAMGSNTWSKADWEVSLSELVVRERATPAGDIALQVDLAPSRSGIAPSVRLRPVARGRTGWIKSGASWSDLERGYRGVDIDAVQREIVREFLALSRRRKSGYYSAYGESYLQLDDLGPKVWRLLREAQEGGFALVGIGARPVVQLRRSRSGGARCSPPERCAIR